MSEPNSRAPSIQMLGPHGRPNRMDRIWVVEPTRKTEMKGMVCSMSLTKIGWRRSMSFRVKYRPHPPLLASPEPPQPVGKDDAVALHDEGGQVDRLLLHHTIERPLGVQLLHPERMKQQRVPHASDHDHIDPPVDGDLGCRKHACRVGLTDHTVVHHHLGTDDRPVLTPGSISASVNFPLSSLWPKIRAHEKYTSTPGTGRKELSITMPRRAGVCVCVARSLNDSGRPVQARPWGYY